jgi:hypothetical protein
MFLDNEFMPDETFAEWLTGKKYVLQHTGIKNQHKLYLDGQLYLVNGLERVTRKKLKIEEKADRSYYRLHPFLADRWERLTFNEYWALKPGEKVYVLLDPLTVREAVFHHASPLAASVVSICEGRATMGYFHYPDNPEYVGWLVWVRFHKPRIT